MSPIKPLICALILLSLAACGARRDTGAELLARQRAIDPPNLWLIKDMDAGGHVQEATWTCADTPTREAFARTYPEVEGTLCRTLGRPVEKPGSVSLRCVADHRRYAFVTTTEGDLAREFVLTVAIRPLGGEAGAAQHTRLYSRQGPCPANWRVGDHARAAG